MNNKLLGSLNTSLWAPADVGSTSGAGIESPGGGAPAASPATENFYNLSTGEEGAPTGGEKQDFSSSPEEGATLDASTSATEEAPGGEEAPAAEQTPAAQPDKPALLKLDPETIAELRKGIAPVAPAAPAAAPQLSREQLKQMLNPVEVDENIAAGITSEDPAVRVQTLQNFANSVVKNAISIARVMIQQKEKELQSTLAPIQENFQKATVEQTRGEFFSSNKDLTKYEKIVQMAAREVNPNKADGSAKSKDEIFKEVAANTRATLQQLGVKIDATANPGAAGNGQSGGVPPPNRLSSVGRSGGDTNGQRGKPNNADADIYQR